MEDEGQVSVEVCPSGGCNETEDCRACEDGDNEEYDGRCYSCGGLGWRVPEHCCQCGGSPYCQCCRTCGGYVGTCKCPIPTERDGKQVTV